MYQQEAYDRWHQRVSEHAYYLWLAREQDGRGAEDRAFEDWVEAVRYVAKQEPVAR